MNLRLTGGKIPVYTGMDRHPIMLVDPPERGLFDLLIGKRINAQRRDIYWKVLHDRLAGQTMKEVGDANGITKERVRQLEAKMVRLLSDHYRSELASEIDLPETIRPLNDNR